MNKIVSPWAAVAALFIICAMVTAIILSGHANALTVATTAVGGICLAAIRVVRGNIPAPAPMNDAPPTPKTPTVPPLVGVLLVLFMLVASFVAACAAAAGVGADATYGGQQTSCVNRATTKAEADVCRQDVDRRWCVVDGSPQCVPEGGSDQ